MPDRFDPIEYANALGLQVVERPLTQLQRAWLPEHRTILVDTGIPTELQRGILGHTLAHAVLGHASCARYRGDVVNTASEWQADRWAARKMIRTDILRDHADLDEVQLAELLNVTPSQVTTYRQAYGSPTRGRTPRPRPLRSFANLIIGTAAAVTAFIAALTPPDLPLS